MTRSLLFMLLLAQVACASRLYHSGDRLLLQWTNTRDVVVLGRDLGDGHWECTSVEGAPILSVCNMNTLEWVIRVHADSHHVLPVVVPRVQR